MKKLQEALKLSETADQLRKEFQIIQDQYILASERGNKKECDDIRIKAHDTLDLLLDTTYLTIDSLMEAKSEALSALYRGRDR